MNRPDKIKWFNAMKEEIESLKKNDVWTLVDSPKGNVVTKKWVLINFMEAWYTAAKFDKDGLYHFTAYLDGSHQKLFATRWMASLFSQYRLWFMRMASQ